MPGISAADQGKQPVSPHRQQSGNVVLQQAGRSPPCFALSRGISALGILHCQLNRSRSFLHIAVPKQSCRLPEQIIYESPQVVFLLGCGQIHLRMVGVSPDRLPATRINRKCQQFCSLCGHSLGSLTDAFLLPWSDRLLYAFPPIPLIHKVLLKIRGDQARVILIAPAWACQHWFATLLAWSVKPPISLLLGSDLMSQNHGCLFHPSLHTLHLMYGCSMARHQGTVLLKRDSRSSAKQQKASRVTYLFKWRCFSIWSCHFGISLSCSSIQPILNYLQYLKHQGLTVNSIKIQLSAISAILQKDNHSVFF